MARQQMCCFSPNRSSPKGRRKTLDPPTPPWLDPVDFSPGGSLQPGVVMGWEVALPVPLRQTAVTGATV